MFALQEGVPVDRAALAERTRTAVADVVARQLDAGVDVDVVSDGEMSKPSYVTYVVDRLTGFGDSSHPVETYADLEDFPSLHRKVFGDPGGSRRRLPACDGPVAVRDEAAALVDVEHLRAALPPGQEGFLNAASPGVIALCFRNDHYATLEEYVLAIAEAMRVEYEAIAGAGLLVQSDCPDLAMGRHIQFGDRTLEEFRREAALNVEALNHATRNLDPERLRMHGMQPTRPTTRGRTTATCRSRTSSTWCSAPGRRRSRSRRPTRATRTSGGSSRTSRCPRARC